MAQSGLASTGEFVPVDQVLVPWPKALSLFFFCVHLSPSGFFPLVNCHGRCKTVANHHLQRPLCIAQPRQADGLHMRPSHYEAFSSRLRSAVWAMAVVSGPMASIAGILACSLTCRWPGG